jgi:hypothetical protein
MCDYGAHGKDTVLQTQATFQIFPNKLLFLRSY